MVNIPERVGRSFRKAAWSGMNMFPERLWRARAPEWSKWGSTEANGLLPRLEGEVRLLIGPANFAGQGNLWARAAEMLPAVQAVSVQPRAVGPIRYEADLTVSPHMAAHSRHWAKRNLELVKDQYTHVLVEAGYPVFGAAFGNDLVSEIKDLKRAGLTVGYIAHGSDVRKPAEHAQRDPFSPFLAMDAELLRHYERKADRNLSVLESVRVPEFVSTVDLLEFCPGATWLPTLVDDHRWSTRKGRFLASPDRKRPMVLHAPSQVGVKGSAMIDAVLTKLDVEGVVEYVRVQGIPSAQMPELVGGADVVVDQIGTGAYGVASLEAMTYGRVVVAGVWPSTRELLKSEFGQELPIVEADPKTLESVIRGLAADRGKRAQLGKRGIEFVEAVHSPQKVAEVLAPFLGVPMQPNWRDR